MPTFKPQLVLLDIMMPGMGGYEACRRIKAAEELRDVPVIMITGSTETEDLQAAFAAGATGPTVRTVRSIGASRRALWWC